MTPGAPQVIYVGNYTVKYYWSSCTGSECRVVGGGRSLKHRGQFAILFQPITFMYFLKQEWNLQKSNKSTVKRRHLWALKHLILNISSISLLTFKQLNQTSTALYTCSVTLKPVVILIQLLTLVYSIVLSEDSTGNKLYLEASRKIRKKAITQGRSLNVSGNPGGTWKLKNHLHCTAMWSKWSYALVGGWG